MGGIEGLDWSVLGGCPVPGDPDAVATMSTQMQALADTAGLQQRLLWAIGVDADGVWSGPAADAFRPHVAKAVGVVGQVERSHGDAAEVLATYSVQLRSAQDLALTARTQAVSATAALAAAQARAQSAASAVGAAAARYNQACSGPAAPGQTATASAAATSAQATYQAAQAQLSAANQAVAEARSQLHAAVSLKVEAAAHGQAAAEVCAQGLRAAAALAPQPEHHSWWDSIVDGAGDFFKGVVHQGAEFVGGVWDGLASPLTMLAKLADPLTAPAELEQLVKGLAYGVTHPLAFGEALIDWKDLRSGNIAHWLGELTPAVAAAVFTGGAGDVAAGVDGVTAAQRAGLSADDLAALVTSGDEQAAARVIMRGDDPVPGSIYPGKPAQVGRDLSWSGTPQSQIAAQAKNFTGPITEADPLPESWATNVHDGSVALRQDGGERSLLWAGKPSDLLDVSGVDEYVQRMALPPEWGARDEVTVLHIPADAPGPSWAGQAAEQTAQDGTVYDGGGQQYLLHQVRSEYAEWTGPPPWAQVPDPALAARGAAKLALGGGGARVVTAVSGQP